MKKDFDLERLGKRMPYTTPDGFFEGFEGSVLRRVKSDGETCRTLHSRYRLKIWACGIAAAIVVLLVLHVSLPVKHKAITATEVDWAFAQLTADDQSYLLNIYQEDVFLNE